MKKILSISNSFGVDATRYLYGVARAAKEDIKIVTLYIGGCSLYRHYRNMLSDERKRDLFKLQILLKSWVENYEKEIVVVRQYKM